MRRHVYYYTYLRQAHEVTEAQFCGDPGLWLPPPARDTPDGWLVDLRAEGVLPSPLDVHGAEVLVGPPVRPSETLIRAISWHAVRADRLMPVVAADLELTALPGGGSQLTLSGTYRPPLSVVGGAADRALSHRVAEACVRSFVLGTERRLSAATLPA